MFSALGNILAGIRYICYSGWALRHSSSVVRRPSSIAIRSPHPMSRVSQLFDLQQIDSSVARRRQIDEQMVDSPELIAGRAASEEARGILAQRQAELKRLQYEAED